LTAKPALWYHTFNKGGKEALFDMAKEICIVIRYFGRGMASLGGGWDWGNRPAHVVHHGLARHFVRVGERMKAATVCYSEKHPEIPVNA